MNRSNTRARWGWLAAPLVAISLVAAACGGGGGPSAAPTVTATAPTDGATDVAIGTDISVTFSMAMNPTTTQAAFSTTPATDCTFSWNAAGTVLTCEPTSDLATNTAYTVTIAATATNTGGTSLGSAATFSFTTASGSPTAPTITATDPADGATNVTIATDVSVTFSQAMNPATTETAFSTAPATDCTFSWNAAGTVLTCEPTSDLATNTAYTVTIATTATNAGGTPLASAFGFGFTTGAAISDTCTFGTSLFGSCRFGP